MKQPYSIMFWMVVRRGDPLKRPASRTVQSIWATQRVAPTHQNFVVDVICKTA